MARKNVYNNAAKICSGNPLLSIVQLGNNLNIFGNTFRPYGADKGIGAEIQQQTLTYITVITYKLIARKLSVSDSLFNGIMIRIQITDTSREKYRLVLLQEFIL